MSHSVPEVVFGQREDRVPSDPDQVRAAVRAATKDFKTSWRNLAKILQVVWEEKLYRDWGFQTFDQYTAKEVHVRKHTAMKLIRSHQFLQKENPRLIGGDKEESLYPSFEAVQVLQKAHKSLDGADYQQVKRQLIGEGREPSLVKKDVTQLMRSRQRDIDPEQARVQQGQLTVKRFLAQLAAFKKEVETAKVLPGTVAQDIDALIAKINSYLKTS